MGLVAKNPREIITTLLLFQTNLRQIPQLITGILINQDTSPKGIVDLIQLYLHLAVAYTMAITTAVTSGITTGTIFTGPSLLPDQLVETTIITGGTMMTTMTIATMTTIHVEAHVMMTTTTAAQVTIALDGKKCGAQWAIAKAAT